MTKKELIYEGEFEIENEIEKNTGDVLFSIRKEKKYLYTIYDGEYGYKKTRRKSKFEIAYRKKVVKNPGSIYLWLKKHPLLFKLMIKLNLIQSLEESFDKRVENAYRETQCKLREIQNKIKEKEQFALRKIEQQRKKEKQNYYNASDALQRAKKVVHQEIKTLSWLEPLINQTSYVIEKSIKRAEQNDDFVALMHLCQMRSSLEEVISCSYNDPEAAELAKNDIVKMLKEIEQKATQYYKDALNKKGDNVKAKIKSQRGVLET